MSEQMQAGIQSRQGARDRKVQLWVVGSKRGLDDLPIDNMTTRQMVDFLHEHLGPYTDTKEAIGAAIAYALSNDPGKGGWILIATDNTGTSDRSAKPVGIAVVNRTGMEKYIPGNILVYIAVDTKARGRGIGGLMVERIKEKCTGGIALHVEYDNPARRLYERLGFTSKYAEMRCE